MYNWLADGRKCKWSTSMYHHHRFIPWCVKQERAGVSAFYRVFFIACCDVSVQTRVSWTIRRLYNISYYVALTWDTRFSLNLLQSGYRGIRGKGDPIKITGRCKLWWKQRVFSLYPCYTYCVNWIFLVYSPDHLRYSLSVLKGTWSIHIQIW